jgi:photosystem II stability/assembly factor-like uncharacterized protein
VSADFRPPWRPFPWLAVLAVLFLVVVSGPGQEPTGDRDRRIDELKKKIEALSKELDALKRTPNSAPPTSSAMPADWVKAIQWRCIGPASMGGRITDISVFEADPTTYYVATASGGLLKTVNAGTTFEHQFDKETTVSIGAVCVAPSNRDIVWIGTGENNPRNSVSYGDGVYKSTDGGKTWKNMGLKETFQIGRIAVHPKNPDVVYVAALGRLWGPNPERGLYKTTDGGNTWERVLYVDDKTGCLEVKLHPSDPDTLLVAMWDRERDGFDSFRGTPPPPEGYDNYDPSRKWGPGAGIFKSTDGGKNFKKLTQGLPGGMLGRICVDYYRKNPNIIFAIVDCDKIGMGTAPKTGKGFTGLVTEDGPDEGALVTTVLNGSPAEKGGLKADDLILKVDDKKVEHNADLSEKLADHKPDEKVSLGVRRAGKDLQIQLTLVAPPKFGGGKGGFGGGGGVQSATAKRPYGFLYGGQKENVQRSQGAEGQHYGGVYKSTDGGETWVRVNSVNPRPMYFSQIRVDPSDEKYVYVLGVKIYRSQNGGKTFRPDGARGVHDDAHALWINPKDGRHMVVGCDGGYYVTYDRMEHWDHLNNMALGQFYHVALDNRKPYRVFGGLQDNGTWGGPSHSLTGYGPINEDWMFVSGGDGFVCRVDPTDPDLVYFESQDGNLGRRNLRTGERKQIRPQGGGGGGGKGMGEGKGMGGGKGKSLYRFNWNTPFILSNHNPRIYYCAGNHVFRSVKQGDDLRVISPEITRTKRGTATALAESPRNPDVLYVGTDDGALWVSRDGGAKWTNISEKVKLPGPLWVATIEPSHHADGRCYVCFDAHRSNDDDPYVFVTEDYGETWTSVRANLPRGSSRVLREDPESADLLFVGTEFSVWASFDRGKSWAKINNNLPTVAVHELAIHPTAGEMVAATHGRSLWVVDVNLLRQLKPYAFTAKSHLFTPAPAITWRSEPGRLSIYGHGSRRYFGENPTPGAQIYYSLTKKAEKGSLRVVDYAGQTVRELEFKKEPGLHRVTWNLARAGAGGGMKGGKGGGGFGGGFGGGMGGKGKFAGGFGGPPVTPGTYRVVLNVDGEEVLVPIRVEADPVSPSVLIAPFEGDDDR